MELLLKYQWLLCLIIVPLIFVTTRNMIRDWKLIWDDDVTYNDRRQLVRISLFLLEPIIVLLHEFGHAITAIKFGGTISEFGYFLLSGYVIPSGLFTRAEDFWIYLSGNLVNFVVGYLCLLAALFVKRPPVVALLVYLGLWTLASSAIFYPLLSIIGVYGDWSNIYGSGLTNYITVLAFFHVLIVASVIYMLKGERPRVWFAKRTRLGWENLYDRLQKRIAENPTILDLLNLAWILYEAALNDLSLKALDRCAELDSEDPEPILLRGYIWLDRRKFELAEETFQRVIANPRSEDLTKARAFMACARTKMTVLGQSRTVNPEKQGLEIRETLKCFDRAINVMPDLGDPRFRKAAFLNELKRYKEACEELDQIQEMRWLDQSLVPSLAKEIKIARDGLAKAEQEQSKSS